MTTGFARTLARSVVAPYVAVFIVVLGMFALGVHLAVALLGDREDRARLETFARAAVAVVDASGSSFEVGEQADAVAGLDQRATWSDSRGRIVATRGASPGALRGRAVEERVVAITDGRGKRIGSVRLEQSDELRERTQRGVDLGLVFGFVLATLASIAGGRFLSRDSIARIAASVRSLEEFSADAAHEMRTPLAAIIATPRRVFAPRRSRVPIAIASRRS